MAERTCERCGEPLPAGKRWNAKYCTDACASTAAVARWRAAKPKQDYAQRVVHRTRNRAKKLGVPFNLEPSDIEVPEVCPILGVPLVTGIIGGCDNSASVDRIIPELGYVKGNAQIISMRANILKSNITVEEVRKLLTYMERQ